MKLSYDPEVDALSIVFRETTVTTKALGEGIAADYDADGKLAGLEVLDAARRFGGPTTLQRVVLEGFPAKAESRSRKQKSEEERTQGPRDSGTLGLRDSGKG